MKPTTLIAATILATLAAAMPLTETQLAKRADPGAVKIVTTIAPSSTSCDASAQLASECVTANDATQPLIDAFSKYKIATPGEQAALLSWMAYESGEFKYVRNHFPAPGRPGQGCRNMMMPNFVQEYAATLGLTNSDPAHLLDDVVKTPGGEWGAASWFYSAKCSDDIKKGVQGGTKAGWQKFITGCVQTTLDSGEKSREVYWTRAAQALGMSIS